MSSRDRKPGWLAFKRSGGARETEIDLGGGSDVPERGTSASTSACIACTANTRAGTFALGRRRIKGRLGGVGVLVRRNALVRPAALAAAAGAKRRPPGGSVRADRLSVGTRPGSPARCSKGRPL